MVKLLSTTYYAWLVWIHVQQTTFHAFPSKYLFLRYDIGHWYAAFKDLYD